MNWLAENWELLATIATAVLAYLAKRWGGGWKEVAIKAAEIVEGLKASDDEEKVDGEELAARFRQVSQNQMSGMASQALQHAADLASARAAPDRRKPANPLKRAGRLLVQTAAENAVTGLLGRIFKRR